MTSKQIRFLLGGEFILIHCPRPEVARELTLKMLIETIKTDDLDLAPTAERLENNKSELVDYLLNS